MIQIIKAILAGLKTVLDCCIIWIIGPDGTIFDLLSIFKIIISGIALIGPLLKLGWSLARRM